LLLIFMMLLGTQQQASSEPEAQTTNIGDAPALFRQGTAPKVCFYFSSASHLLQL
jgi:hypothetical protein